MAAIGLAWDLRKPSLEAIERQKKKVEGKMKQFTLDDDEHEYWMVITIKEKKSLFRLKNASSFYV